MSDGRGGTKLRVNFGSDFRNAGFETGDAAPWTSVQQMVELGVTQIAGFTTQDTATYPANSGGDGDAPTSGTYTVAVTSANPPGPTEGTYALGLRSSMTTQFGCDVVHGPAAYSAAFDAVAGQTLNFDWRAYAGSDAYAVFGYLLNTADGTQTEVLDTYTINASGSTNWATVAVTVPANGSYRFVFVAGTYDATCGRAAGGSLYVDNFQVVSASFVDDAIVSKVAEKLTYENASDDPPATRTVVVSVENVSAETATGDITVNITPVNDVPVGTPVSVQWENTTADDVFADITGTLSFTDPDDATFTFGITGGTQGTYSIGGIDYDVALAGTYGTLYVDDATGAYRVVGNDAAIEAVSTPIAEAFTVTAFDGTDTGSMTFTLGVTLPPAPRNVVGTPGNSQVSVSWDKPIIATGVTGYQVTSSPDGQTCSTVGVDSVTCVVTGLTNGTPYTFTVLPTTATGFGTVSLPSLAVTPTGPPTAPQNVTGTDGGGRVLVAWDPPANDGGTPITGYTVTTSPGGATCTTTGAANCTVLGLAIGTTYTFTVVATNVQGNGPASSPVSVTLKSSTATSLTASPTSANVGVDVTLTATVTGASPSGSVEFFDGTTSLGTAAVSGGTAQIITGTLSAGARSITAAYGGDATNNTSVSSATTVTVVTVATVTLAASGSTPSAGAPLTLTATVTGNTPTGSVEFFDGTTSLGTVALAAGEASIETSSLALGSHSLTAVYSGDTLNTTATSSAATVTVLTVAGVAVAASTETPLVGDPVTLTATVTGNAPSGTVEFFDGVTSLGVVAVSGGTAAVAVPSFVAGDHSITAIYSGDAGNTTATSTVLTVNSSKTTATIALAASDETPFVDDPVTLTATVTGSSPTGSVEFFDGVTSLGVVAVSGGTASVVLPGFAAGDHSITATYSGDPSNSSVTSGDLSVTSRRHTSTVTLTSLGASPLSPSLARIVVGDEITFVSAVAGQLPSGSVEFRIEQGGVLWATTDITLTAGSATLATSSLPVGEFTVAAVYSGDGINGTGTSTVLNLTVAAVPAPVVANPEPTVGSTIPVTGDGYEPNTPVEILLDVPGGTVLATVITDADGSFSTTVTLPAGALGNHSLVILGQNSAGGVASAELPIAIVTLPSTGGDPTQVANLGGLLVAAGVALMLWVNASNRRTRRCIVSR